MTSKDLIRAIGEALWGAEHWRSEMSDALGGVNPRTVQRWASGTEEPAPVCGGILSRHTRPSTTPSDRRRPKT